jgi:hypothetical protein
MSWLVLYLSLSLRIICVTLMFGLKLEVRMSWSKEHITKFEVSISKHNSKIKGHDLRDFNPVLVVVASKQSL